MIPGYDLGDELAGNEQFRIVRARGSRDGARVLLCIPRADPPRTTDMAALAHQCAIIAGLAIGAELEPRIADARRPGALVLRDPGGYSLAQRPRDTSGDVKLALTVGIRIAATLEELHARGFNHQGIRPEAVLCDVEDARAWLVDFGDVTAALDPADAPAAAFASASRLAYVAPERAGRMDKSPDHRSDLYSLGVVLYEILTATLPFRGADALELIHSHLARTPAAPAHIDARIPGPLSDVVLKLLAKDADERYQSARSLREDLETCARDWDAHGSIAPFPLGRRDIAQRFRLSPKLYGREREVAALQRAFERARDPRGAAPLLMLVAGYSGVGKTALIQQLYKPIARRRGYFATGKFDQVVRNLPMGALIQAFRALLRQLFTESEARIAHWRQALLQALGSNAGVLAEVIPEIEVIIGKQLPVIPLAPTETQNRFEQAFQNFVAALAQPEHPLVLFLDDLQWADAATLRLLGPLLTSRDIRCLLLIGAYRDNEVDARHPLQRTLADLESGGVELQHVALGPLELEDLAALIGDTLGEDAAEVLPLARLVQEKTGGNPFFVTQFLQAIWQDGFVEFDLARGRWTSRIDAIAAAPLTDNVIDLMTRKIQRLSRRTQRALTLAACIGSTFDCETLATVTEQTPDAVAGDLQQAVDEGLLLPGGERTAGGTHESTSTPLAFTFLHDRVQQSTYALIPAANRQQVHLSVGRLLCSRVQPGHADERIFSVVHHLNLGRGLVTDEAERLSIARLNLGAGQKAKSAAAHEAALGYLQAGVELLSERAWADDYDLAFTLHVEHAESLYLCGDFEAAERQFEWLLGRAATSLDKARVCRLRSVQYENMARYPDALASARVGLRFFGVALPDTTTDREAALEREIAAIATLQGGRSIGSLIDLPRMADVEIRTVMAILTDIWASSYLLGDPSLPRLLSATMVRLSLEHGNVEESAYGYVTHAITVGPVRGDYQSAYEFGLLALAVNERFADSRRRAKIYQQFHAHVNFWRQPMRTCIPYAREACRSGLENGDFLYAAYGAGTETWSAIIACQDLAQFVRDYRPAVALIERLKNRGFADSVKLMLNWVHALQDTSRAPFTLSSDALDESTYLERYRDNPFFTTFHAVAKLHLAYVFGQFRNALAAARTAQATVYRVAGTVWPLLFEFWYGLTLAANYGDAGEADRVEYAGELDRIRRAFDALAMNCAENFQCQALLLGAEGERIAGRHASALLLYERAVDYADETGNVQHQALANELYARFRLERGQPGIAAMFMGKAQARYAQWGAAAKVDQLAQAYPTLGDAALGLVRQETRDRATPAGPAPADGADGMLDFASVTKAAQTIASETDLERLLENLMRIVIENAGAERGTLLLERQGDACVHAEGSLDSVTTHLPDGIPLAESGRVPAGIVNYVRRTQEALVLADALNDDRYGDDPYFAVYEPRSVLCVPVLQQGRLIGVLYLENNMTRGAFTPDRIQTMQVLSTEVAVSLENAKLIDGLKREIRERQRAQDDLRAALTEVEALKNELEAENTYLRRDLIANVSHDLRTPLASLRGYLETLLLKGDALPADKRRHYLEIAGRQSEHLAKLVEELFELARLDFKGLALALEPLQMGELAADVVQKFQLAADQKQVAIEIEAPARIPWVRADTGMVERVFENLIGNALKFTPAGGRVNVSVAPEGARVIARVRDNGSGIAEADLPFVFDRSFRADKSRSSAGGGAGLGLAITKRIIELHSGEISIESAPRAGTCISFSLPVFDARQAS